VRNSLKSKEDIAREEACSPHPNKKQVDSWCYASGGGYIIYDCPDCGKKGIKRYLGEDLKTELPTATIRFSRESTEKDTDKDAIRIAAQNYVDVVREKGLCCCGDDCCVCFVREPLEALEKALKENK